MKNSSLRKLAIRLISSGCAFALILSVISVVDPAFAGSTTIQHQITISEFKFQPENVDVSSGDSISWINKDIVPHTIALFDDNNTVLSPVIKSGETFTLVVKQSLAYICGLHPTMHGKITVSD